MRDELRQRLWSLVLAQFLSATVFASPRASNAAEVTCFATYQQLNPLDNLNRPLSNWPSGRLPKKTTCGYALIRGAIEAGDSEKFERIIQDNHPFLSAVYLWSSEGSVSEAAKIGLLIRHGLIATTAAQDLSRSNSRTPIGVGSLAYFDRQICFGMTCHCAGACFFIWAAGVARYGTSLGLPRTAANAFSYDKLSPDEADKKDRGGVESYLAEMDVPHSIIKDILAAPSPAIRWVSEDQALDMEQVPSSIDRFKLAECNPLNAVQKKTLALLDSEVRARRNLPDSGASQRDELAKRTAEYRRCEEEKIRKARDAIQLPSRSTSAVP